MRNGYINIYNLELRLSFTNNEEALDTMHDVVLGAFLFVMVKLNTDCMVFTIVILYMFKYTQGEQKKHIVQAIAEVLLYRVQKRSTRTTYLRFCA